jgi:molybdopterin molybdotransferase
MMERTELVEEDRVRIGEPPKKAGQNILPQGREMRRGEVVLKAGVVLRPQEIGTLAAVGCTQVPVYRRPTVAVVPTGDEIVEPQEKPSSGHIRNSNASMLQGQIARAGARPMYLGIARDNLASLRQLITKGLEHDVLVLSGGVSAGKLDLVPGVLQELGVTPIFHKIAMKPGKPLFFGVKGDTIVFGLPGNPVSSLVGFELFVRPALRVMMGQTETGTTLLPAKLACDFTYSTDRPTYHPARLELSTDGWHVRPVTWFGSADLRAISSANAFVLFNTGENVYHEGDAVEVLAPEL